ncbi:hypothetical protein ABG79_01422 [Caloramator mitchellensis]|uniref:Peptidase C39-like domain-containing protein n=1 Tax=Caloramator mitchellensis TaxID=908809 RepID=A0A0R3JT31_CALMK|nr:C39 family peptidase [Caloramator mitchellensis]KRQ86675.1 hypothetical protein ABG79_01422 [Caloramator mitchellensis]
MKKIFILLITFVFLMTNTVVTFASTKTKYVSEKEAIKAAEKFIKKISKHDNGWNYEKLDTPILLSDLKGNKNAYMVKLINQGKAVGYIIVSATKDKMPVLAASLSTPPDEQLEEIKQKAQQLIDNNRKLGNPKYYYINPLMYIVELPIIENGKEVDKTFYNTKSKEFVDKQTIDLLKNIDIQPTNAVEANKVWEATLNDDSLNSSIEVSPQGYSEKYNDITAFDSINYNQDASSYPENACGPTAGAMLLQYWKTKGYPNIRGVSYYGSVGRFIDHLKIDMNTGSLGTTAPNWLSGVLHHANVEGGYHFQGSHSTPPSYSTYTSEIDKSKPVGIRFNNLPYISGHYYSWHFVLGRGYYYDTSLGDREIKINDSWGGTDWFNYDEYYDHLTFIYITPAN